MSDTPLDLRELIDLALGQGIAQVAKVGSPLHPFFIDERRTAYFLFDSVGGKDPMELALPAIKTKAPNIQRCALVIDTRIAVDGSKKCDAIVVMACEHNKDEGEVWAQRYVPKGLFRKFRTEGARERIANAQNFIKMALADT